MDGGEGGEVVYQRKVRGGSSIDTVHLFNRKIYIKEGTMSCAR